MLRLMVNWPWGKKEAKMGISGFGLPFKIHVEWKVSGIKTHQ